MVGRCRRAAPRGPRRGTRRSRAARQGRGFGGGGAPGTMRLGRDQPRPYGGGGASISPPRGVAESSQRAWGWGGGWRIGTGNGGDLERTGPPVVCVSKIETGSGRREVGEMARGNGGDF